MKKKSSVFRVVHRGSLLLHVSLKQEGTTVQDMLSQTSGKSAEWMACKPGGIDRTLLQDQSIPILLYDDVALFEDFIHDHGVVRLSVKTRVMPQCWYVLLRYWLRVDNVVMKVCKYSTLTI